MECINHSEVDAMDRCAGCAEAFCENCLVEVLGQKYCRECKYMAVKTPPVIAEATTPCKLASEALTYAIIGIFCFGIILGPVAISKAFQAKKEIGENPKLNGSVKANIAILIGVLDVIGFIAGIATSTSGV